MKKNYCILKTFGPLNEFEYFFHCECCFQILCLNAADRDATACTELLAVVYCVNIYAS